MIYAAQLRYLAQIAPKSPFFTRDALSGMTFVRAQKLSITVLPGTMHHAPRTTHHARGIRELKQRRRRRYRERQKSTGIEKQNNNFHVHLAIKRWIVQRYEFTF